MRQLWQWLQKLLLVVAGVVFALVLCETGLGLLGIEYPHFYDFDPLIGTRLRPGIKGYWLKEGGGYVSINSDGLRDREHAIVKPPNTLRIAVLGDSFAEAMQVNQEETFFRIMEKELQRCSNPGGRNIEVINFGVSGFGTTQELLTLRSKVWKYSPDIVLLAFTSGNDVSDNSPILNKGDTYSFLILQDGNFRLDDNRLKRRENIQISYEQHRNWLGHLIDKIYTWRNDSCRIMQLVDHVQEVRQEAQLSKASQDNRQGRVGAGMFTKIYHEPRDEEWREAWKITEDLLLAMRDEVAQGGAQFDVVLVSNDIQVHPEPSVRREIEDVFYPDHRVEKFCKSHGIPVLLLAPYFQEYATQHQVFLHGFRTLFRNTLGHGHWNQKGHKLAGETIAKWLCSQINQPQIVSPQFDRNQEKPDLRGGS
jgi:hypothetical protein